MNTMRSRIAVLERSCLQYFMPESKVFKKKTFSYQQYLFAQAYDTLINTLHYTHEYIKKNNLH